LVVFNLSSNVTVEIYVCEARLSGCHSAKQVKPLSRNSLVKTLLHQVTKVVCSLLVFAFMGQNPFEVSFITEGISWQSENPIIVRLASSIFKLADMHDVAFDVISTQIVIPKTAHRFNVLDIGCDGL